MPATHCQAYNLLAISWAKSNDLHSGSSPPNRVIDRKSETIQRLA